MPSYNQVVLMGNLTRDPERKETASGTVIVNLSLAVNRRIKRGDTWEEEANFFDVVVFGKTAENCVKYLVKGRPVLIDGELQQDRWETKDGKKRSKVKIVARLVQFLGGRKEQEERPREPDREPDDPPLEDDDDIPF